MAKVYVSSTFQDLNVYRNATINALRKAGYVVEAMEDYVATGRETPLTKCLSDVGRCDYYVGIFAWRYGFVPDQNNPEQKSITELEYREAERLKKPCFLFLLDPNTSWPPNFIDSITGEGEQGRRIKALREDMGRKKLASFFKTPEELATVVTAALSRWQSDHTPVEESQSFFQEFELEEADRLLLDSKSVDFINIALETARRRYEAGCLTDDQLTEFFNFRNQVKELLILNKKLRILANDARQLLKKTRESIQNELNELRNTNSSKLQENEILKQFQDILDAGEEAAKWLDENREILVKKSAEFALNSYSELIRFASDEDKEEFEWEIEKYLKRISHCLVWSNYNLIDEPDGLTTFEVCLYRAAFEYVRNKRIHENPPDIPNHSIALLLDCFDHLIRRL